MIDRDYLQDIKVLDNLLYEYMMDNHYYEITPILEPVSEGYIGKTPNLLKIENLLGKLHNQIGPYVGDREDNYITMNKLLYDPKVKDSKLDQHNPIIKEINKLFIKEFGFKDFEFHISSLLEVGSFTGPDSFVINDITGKNIWNYTLHGKKYYDNDHIMKVYVNSGIRENQIFTPEEQLAVILHEIGHNFDVSLSARISDILTHIGIIFGGTPSDPVGFMYHALNILSLLIGSRAFKVYMHMEDMYVKIVGTRFYNTLQKMFEVINSVAVFDWYKKGNIVAAIELGTNPIFFLSRSTGAGKEAYADSFAVAYGYGPALSSALIKLDKNYSLITGNRYLDGFFYDVSYINVLLGMFVDCHPDTLSRISMNIKNLEKISNDPSLPKSYRNEVKKNLEQSRKIYNDYLNEDPRIKHSIVRKIAYFLGDKIFGGQIDLRTYIMGVSACNIPKNVEKADESEIRQMIHDLISGNIMNMREYIYNLGANFVNKF